MQQKNYGKIVVPINKKMGVPSSPEVWASFLTGKWILGLEFDRVHSAGRVLSILKHIRKYIPLSLGIGPRFLDNKAPRSFPKLSLSTFVDLPGVSEINAPYYSYDHTILEVIQQFGEDEISMRTAVRRAFDIFKQRKKQIGRSILDGSQESRVIFAYVHFPDVIQHFTFLKPRVIKEHYFELDDFVLRLKDIISDAQFIIVSDHGFNTTDGSHSLYGFYSSNIDITPEPKRITDFYEAITQRLEE